MVWRWLVMGCYSPLPSHYNGGIEYHIPSKDYWKDKVYVRPRFWKTSGFRLNHSFMQKGTGSPKTQTLHINDIVLIACKWCDFSSSAN